MPLKKQKMFSSDENRYNHIHQNEYSKPFKHVYQAVGQSVEFSSLRITFPQLFCKMQSHMLIVWFNILAIGSPVYNQAY